jgi:hypothetical protein
MRIPGLRRTGFAALVLAPLLALSAAGCAKRLPLTEKELERIKTESGVQPLRVYTSKKLINIRNEANVDEKYQVQKRIQESSDRLQDKELITKDTSGIILKLGEVNGSTAAWVTFDPRYDKPEDAMVFVQGDDGTFRLSTVPERKGFEAAQPYRGCKCKRRLLKPGKMKSLAEANDVLLVKKKNGKILTIELQVKKIIDDRTRTRTRRVEGID